MVAGPNKSCTLGYESIGNNWLDSQTETSNPQRKPPTCTTVGDDQQGNLPEGPRGIGEISPLAAAMLDKKPPMQQRQTADQPILYETIRPQDYCCFRSIPPKTRHRSNAIMAIVASARSLISSGVHAPLMMVLTHASVCANQMMSRPTKKSGQSITAAGKQNPSAAKICALRGSHVESASCTKSKMCPHSSMHTNPKRGSVSSPTFTQSEVVLALD